MLMMVNSQCKAIKKIGSTQDEQRFLSVQKEAADGKFYVPNPHWHIPKPCVHASLLHPHNARLRTCIPIHTDLLRQPARSQRKVCPGVYQKAISAIAAEGFDCDRNFGITDQPKGGNLL